MENNTAIKATDIYKSYSTKAGKDTPVLKGLSVEIFKGEFSALMGPSGVGKSTLLYILGSLDYPDKGKVELFFNGKSHDYGKISSAETASFRNKGIGFVFQFHHLLPEFTALENVMMPALIAGTSYSEAAKRANELLKIVDVDIRSSHKPMELSGGEQQRIAIARALINHPQLVLADEPTGNLDTKNASSVLDLIQDLRKKYNLTFVVATHSQEVANIAERILIMGDGRIVEERFNKC